MATPPGARSYRAPAPAHAAPGPSRALRSAAFAGEPCYTVPARSGQEDAAGLARDDLIQATGTVEKILGGGRYQVGLDSGQTVTAQLSGRMRRFRIRVIPGDRVQVGLSPYDPTHGFITFRLREGQTGPAGPDMGPGR
jgi:translation initiation factor IF-1